MKTTVQGQLELPNPIRKPGHEFVMAIVLAYRMLSSVGRELLGKSGLTEAQFNILMLLKHQFRNGTSQVQLSKRMLVNRANVTGLIDRLERDGLVERTQKENDRRTYVVRMTKAGAKKLKLAETAYFAGIRKIGSRIRRDDQAAAVAVLLTLCGVLNEDFPGSSG